MRKALMVFIALVMVTTACQSDPPNAAPPGSSVEGTPSTDADGQQVVDLDGTELVLTSSLRTFPACDALLDHLRTEAMERVGPYGLDGGGVIGIPEIMAADDDGDIAVDDMAEGDMAAEESADTTSAAGGGSREAAGPVEGVDFSGTNVQELGVDEADIVKTDGNRILVVSGNELVVVDAISRAVTGRVALSQGWSRELFLDGDEVLVLTRGEGEGEVMPLIEPRALEDDEPAADEGVIIGGRGGGPETVIEQVSLVDGPRVTETVRLEGDYVSARAVDGTARIVVRSNPQYRLPFVFPQSSTGDAEERALEVNREVVAGSTLDDWLPGYTRTLADGTGSEGLLADCDGVHAPTSFSGFGVVSVLSMPVSGGFDASDTASVLAPGDIVYASATSLYVATNNFLADDGTEETREALVEAGRTSVHRFDISAPAASYTASGSVPGTIRDQFSLSEWNGFLRLVTTEGGFGEDSESFVRIMQESGGELVQVGSVGNLGNGEQVQSVRFVGDIGYVVTFRQIDPFYTVDLSDPTNPRVLGELKIPGFSSYLHPLGDGLVLGVGSDADLETGQVTGSKVSLFDVSDLANPIEVATWIAPDGWNEVGWEHRSFLWWAPERLAVVPVSIWSEGYAGAVVLRVGEDSLTEVGRIDHDDPGATPGVSGCVPITAEDLGIGLGSEITSELGAVVSSGSGEVLVCSEGEAPQATGFECFAEPFLTELAREDGIEIGDGQQIHLCYPNLGLHPILRTLVIGDELWSLSYRAAGIDQQARLQVNDLASLGRLEVITP